MEKLEKKKKMQDLKFESKKLELERKKSLLEIEADIKSRDSDGGILKTIRKIKKMKNSNGTGNDKK